MSDIAKMFLNLPTEEPYRIFQKAVYYRRRSGITRDEMAKAYGVCEGNLSRIENSNPPSERALTRYLARFLDITGLDIKDLLGDLLWNKSGTEGVEF